MVHAARYAFAALVWAFVAAILLQVFFIGLWLFGESSNLKLHADFGWILHLAPVPILLAAALAGAGLSRILQAVALAVLIFFVPILAAVRADLPFLAAFHPVGALLAFLLATVIARGATSLVGSTDAVVPTPIRQWILVAIVAAIVLFLSLSGSPALA